MGAGCCYGSVSVFERRCPFASICCLSAQTVWQSHANICICTSRVGDLMGDIMHMLATAGLSNSSAGQSPHLSTLIRTWCSSAAVGEAARHALNTWTARAGALTSTPCVCTHSKPCSPPRHPACTEQAQCAAQRYHHRRMLPRCVHTLGSRECSLLDTQLFESQSHELGPLV